MSIVLHGVSAGKGIAIGRARLIVRGFDEVPQHDLADGDIAAEVTRFEAAINGIIAITTPPEEGC